MVLSTNADFKDAQIKFMKPAGPSPSFSWPKYDDICNIPITNILCKVEYLVAQGSGRMYKLAEKCVAEVTTAYSRV